MSSFLEKLKKQIGKIEVEKSNTVDEYKSAFRDEISAIIQVYLETMSKRLKVINTEIINAIKEVGNESVAAQDPSSKKIERRILVQIDTWIRQDDGLRERFKNIVSAYSKKLSSVDMRKEFDSVLLEFEQDFKSHVEEANNYAFEWKKLLDKVSFTFTNRIVLNTLAWFSNLSVDELKRDFIRDLNEKKVKLLFKLFVIFCHK